MIKTNKNRKFIKITAIVFLMLILVFAIYLVSAIRSPMLKAPIAQWNFDEGQGLTTQDSSGSGNNGNLNGGVLWTNDSRSGQALQFDGIDDMVGITATPSLYLVNYVTVDAWVKRTSTTDGMIFSKNGPYFLAIRNNVIEGGIYSNSGSGNQWIHINGTTPLQQNVWYHLKLVYDGQNISLYVNNILDGTIAKTGPMPYTGQGAYVGWGQPGHNQYFTGIIDNVAIYDIPIY